MTKITIGYREDTRPDSRTQHVFASDCNVRTCLAAKRLFCQYTPWKSRHLRPASSYNPEVFEALGRMEFYEINSGHYVGYLEITPNE